MARKSGVVRHLLGHHLRKETDQYDTIAFGSMGKITSLDKNGDFNWQVYRQCPVIPRLPGLEVIKLEYSLRLKTKCNDLLLADMCLLRVC